MTKRLYVFLFLFAFMIVGAVSAQHVDTLCYKIVFQQTIPNEEEQSIQKLVLSKVGIYSFEYTNKYSSAIMKVNREIDDIVIRNLFGRLGVELKKCEMLPLQPIKD